MMSFLSVLVMNLILLAVTVLLVLADKLLVSYGTVKLVVNKEGEDRKEFKVEGGATLLTYLTEHGIEVSSSCGGKGSCGYCKCQVTKGGGPILPTEEIFMSRQEKAEGMRLACQVKVKEDIEILIPNYLKIVRRMVEGKKFDPNKRWLVTIN